MYIKVRYLVLCGIIFTGCQSNRDKKDTQTKSKAIVEKKNILRSDEKKNEDFDLFFKKFESERSFQLSRIKFPLRMESYNEEGMTTRLEKQYEFSDLTKIKNLEVKKIKKSRSEIDLTLAITDTGTQVVYHFAVKNGKWWLFGTTDQSD